MPPSFSVVATEIGALASQTFQTVDGINEIVKDVNEAVANMTECIQVIMNFLEETVVADYSTFGQVGERYEKDAVKKTLEGYEHLRESETSLNLLKDLIEKFNV